MNEVCWRGGLILTGPATPPRTPPEPGPSNTSLARTSTRSTQSPKLVSPKSRPRWLSACTLRSATGTNEHQRSRSKRPPGANPDSTRLARRPEPRKLAARLERRRLELDLESDLHNNPPTVVAAAVVVPQGLLDELAGKPHDPADAAVRAETDRRAVAAVMNTERALGRVPEQQHHSNPGYDVLSTDPTTGVCYFIEVKGHLPQTEQISVSKRQVGQAKCSPERWRLAVVSVPEDPDAEPQVRYLINPFEAVTLHPAQTSVPFNVAELLTYASPPQ